MSSLDDTRDDNKLDTNAKIGSGPVLEEESHLEVHSNTDNNGAVMKMGLEEGIFHQDGQALATVDASNQGQHVGVREDISIAPNRTMSSSTPYMAYYNGYQSSYYRPYSYNAMPNPSFNYYGGRIAQQYPSHMSTEENIAHSYIGQPNSQMLLPSKSAQAVRLEQNYQIQSTTSKANISRPMLVDSRQDGLNINHYEPMGLFRISKPKSKSIKNSIMSKQKHAKDGERPHACDFPDCGWAFARHSDLKRHRKSHSEPTFHCPYWRNDPTCHKNGGAFNRLDVLKRHLRLVHYIQDKESKSGNSRDYSGWCRSCQRMFSSSKAFIDHCLECARSISSRSLDKEKNSFSVKPATKASGREAKMNSSYFANGEPQTENSIYLSEIAKIQANEANTILRSPSPNMAENTPQGAVGESFAHEEQQKNSVDYLQKFPTTNLSYSESSKLLSNVAD